MLSTPQSRRKQRASLRLAIVSPVRLCRDGLMAVLGEEQDLEIVHSSAPQVGLAQELLPLRLDAIVIDLGSETGRSFLAECAESIAQVPLVAIAVDDRPEQVLACARHQVAAFVPSSGSARDLIEAIRGLSVGEFVCSKRSAAMLYRQLQRLARFGMPQTSLDCLTLREREVLSYLGRGSSNKEIARALSIQLATVKNHVHHILEKLRVHSRGEAAALVAQRMDA